MYRLALFFVAYIFDVIEDIVADIADTVEDVVKIEALGTFKFNSD